MDEALDRVSNTIKRKGFELILFLWSTLNAWYEWCEKSWEGAKTIHKPDTWVFMEKNQYPIIIKEESINRPNTFYTFDPINNLYLYGGEQTGRSRRFNVLNVRLNMSNTSVDISDFFSTVRWKCTHGPALLEMVLLWNLINKNYIPVKKVREGVLVVQDDELEIHTIELSSGRALEEFNGW